MTKYCSTRCSCGISRMGHKNRSKTHSCNNHKSKDQTWLPPLVTLPRQSNHLVNSNTPNHKTICITNARIHRMFCNLHQQLKVDNQSLKDHATTQRPKHPNNSNTSSKMDVSITDSARIRIKAPQNTSSKLRLTVSMYAKSKPWTQKTNFYLGRTSNLISSRKSTLWSGSTQMWAKDLTFWLHKQSTDN